jgi:hypothetical protein
MSEVQEPPIGARGSLRHTWWYVNREPDLLSAVVFTALPSLAQEAVGDITWVSPLGDELECWNLSFLTKLDLLDWEREFRAFWPFSGMGTPHWDALATVQTNEGLGVIMVEAKAHLSEFDKPEDATGAKSMDSLAKIRKGCADARSFYGVRPTIPAWETRYYQVSNRLTHLWWMHAVPKRPTWLVWLLFTDDNETWANDSRSAHEWSKIYARVLREVGLGASHKLENRIAPVYLPPSPASSRHAAQAAERMKAMRDARVPKQ